MCNDGSLNMFAAHFSVSTGSCDCSSRCQAFDILPLQGRLPVEVLVSPWRAGISIIYIYIIIYIVGFAHNYVQTCILYICIYIYVFIYIYLYIYMYKNPFVLVMKVQFQWKICAFIYSGAIMSKSAQQLNPPCGWKISYYYNASIHITLFSSKPCLISRGHTMAHPQSQEELGQMQKPNHTPLVYI